MLIPSIDLMGGKIVQLVQGRKKALEFDNCHEWIRRFSKYPLVQLVDLDAAMGSGHNRMLLEELVGQLSCQVGGGIRSIEDAQAALAAGAQRVIIGSALVADGGLNQGLAERMATALGSERLVFAVDAIGGRVATHGWRELTAFTPLEMVRVLEPCCTAFLYTHIETEGLLQGFPGDVIRPLRASTSRQVIAAGGIRSQEEVDQLHTIGVDAVVGMAIYQELLPA